MEGAKPSLESFLPIEIKNDSAVRIRSWRYGLFI
jgi:hypothetical protein